MVLNKLVEDEIESYFVRLFVGVWFGFVFCMKGMRD